MGEPLKLILGFLGVSLAMYAGTVSAPFTATLSGVGTMPASAPWNTLQSSSFRIEGRIHGITYPGVGPNPFVFDIQDTSGGHTLEFHIDSTNFSVNNYWDTVPQNNLFVAHQGMTDFYFRYVRNASALTQTLEIWQYNSAATNYRLYSVAITTLATITFNKFQIGGAMTSSAGFVRIRSGAVVTGLSAPHEYDSTADILDYEFENDGTETAAGANLTYTGGTPVYATSPVYAPACNSGTPITWRAGTAQALDGSSSFSLNGLSTLSYRWQQTAGPSSLVFSSITASSPTITGILATNTLSAAMYQFQLTVTDSTAVSSSCTASYGAVATDANGSVVIPDTFAAQVIGPQLKLCPALAGCADGTPWPYMDDRAAYFADMLGRSISTLWPQDWNTPATGTIVCTFGSQSCVGTGTNFVTDICTPGAVLVLYYPSADYAGTANPLGRGLHAVSSCADATHLTLTYNYSDSAGTTPSMQYALMLQTSTAYTNFVGISNITTIDYYDNVLAYYSLFYRTGNTVYLTYARQLADLVWTSPWWDRGRPWAIRAAALDGAPWSMENRKYAMQGIMLRANDGQPGMWTGIRHCWDWENYTFNGPLGTNVISDHREQGFAMSYLGLCALLDPSGTQRTACLTTLTGITTQYMATAQGVQSPYGTIFSPWASYSSPTGIGYGSLVKVIDGSTTVTVVSGTPTFGSVAQYSDGGCNDPDTCSGIWLGTFTTSPPAANTEGDSRSYGFLHIRPNIVSISNTTTPIQVTATAHGFLTGESVYMSGTAIPALNGSHYLITVIDANTFSLNGTAPSGTSGAVGTASNDNRITLSQAYSSGNCTGPAGCTNKGWAVGALNGRGQLSYMVGVFLNALDLNRQAATAAADSTHATQWAGWENQAATFLTDSSQAYWTADKGLYGGSNFVECTPRGNNVPPGVSAQCAPPGDAPRFYLAEVIEGFAKQYAYSPNPTRKSTIDTMLNGMYAVSGSGFASLTPPDGSSVDSTLGNAVLSSLGGQAGNLFTKASVNKYFGFFFGFGNNPAWSSARLGGVSPAVPRTMNVGFRLADVATAAKVRVNYTQPDGTVVTNTCTASPCAITADAREGTHITTLDYLTAGDVLLRSASQTITTVQ